MNMALESDYLTGGPDFNGPNYPWINSAALEKWNPARPELVKNWTTPMLVIQNDRDYRCAVTEGIGAFNTLQMLGTPSRFLHFPDEGHFISKPDNALEWHRVVFDWMNKYSGASGSLSHGGSNAAPEGTKQ